MVSKILFRLARSRLLDVIVRFGFARLSGLLPVRRVRETREIIAFRHPRPSWPRHVLFVPKVAIPTLLGVRRSQVWLVRELFLMALDTAARTGLDREGFVVMVNGGAYQDVGQLHVHLAGPALELWYVGADAVPGDILAETDALTAYRHPRPRRATHVVIQAGPRGSDPPVAEGFDAAFVDAAIGAAQDLVRRLNLVDAGYTLLVSRPPGEVSTRPCFHLVAGAVLA